jgi:phosphoglycerol transferase MdoB-like AlkP superfamily enzyme
MFSGVSVWERFFRNIQQDIKLFVYMLLVFNLFRIGFIIVLHSYLSDIATVQDILASLYYGTRMSLKSAGIAPLLSLLVCTALSTFTGTCKTARIRAWIGYAYIVVLSILFYARIPYYEQFHMAFNEFLFNTFNDDVKALFYTFVQQYNLVSRLTMAAVTAWVLCRLLHRWLQTGTVVMPPFSRKRYTVMARTAVLFAVVFLMIFSWFGGSLTYAYDITWENSGVTRDSLLNEAILDDVQALYRAYVLHERLRASNGITIDEERLAQYGARLAGKPVDTRNVDDYMKKQAQGPHIKKPLHIFLIISESYANWALQPPYKDLNIANGLKSIIAEDHAAYVQTFLPNGMGTIAGVSGIVTGMPEVNMYVNYQAETYNGPYASAIAPQLKKLGYRTRFWYAGPDSWERIKEYTLAQGFDEFHSYGEIASKGGNVWGCDDKYLFDAVESGFAGDIPTFDVILTVSNHAPYTVDLAEEGFDPDNVAGGLPDKLKGDSEFIKKLGHFWYADKELAGFVRTMYKQYPDSLFMITGDHADRLNIETNPDLYTRYAIPFVVYGRGVTKQLFPPDAAGSHINITPTLIELIAPAGFTYYSAGGSLTLGNRLGFNYGFWITGSHIGKIDTEDAQALPGAKQGLDAAALDEMHDDIDASRAVSWWRIKNGRFF